MALTSKPSETNKFVVQVSEEEKGKKKFNSFNNPGVNIKISSHTEDDLMELLQQKIDDGWYQVSNIFLEIGDNSRKVKYDSLRKSLKPVEYRNKKLIKDNTYFVYISKTPPRTPKMFTKAY